MLDVDADGRIDALYHAMAWSRGFSLIFVHVPVGPARQELLERFRAWSGRDEMPEIVEVTLKAREEPFQRLMDLALDPDKRTAVVLMGLEQYATGQALSPALQGFNGYRDVLPDVVPGPLVLVASDAVYMSLSANAQDTFNWRAFEISVNAVGEPTVEHIEQAPVPEASEDALEEVTRLREIRDLVLSRPHGALEAARMRLRLGQALIDAFQYDEAEPELQSAREAFHAEGDQREADCLLGLGRIAFSRSDYEGARGLYEQALPLFRRVGRVLGEANCIRSLGDIALQRSDHEGARRMYEQALPLYRRVGDVLGEANCILSLGNIALRRSDHESARGMYEQALPLYRRVGSVLGEANCIRSLGDIALRRSDHEGARGMYEQALPLYRRVGSVLGEANCILSLGDIALARSDRKGARARYEHALHLYERVPEPYSIGHAHKKLAGLAPNREARRAHLDAARAVWETIGRADLVATLEKSK